MQVHYAAQSHFASNSQAWGENSQNTTSPIPPAPPSNFHGYRCYVDAATAPDSNNLYPKFAGLGIFIVNTEVNPPFSTFIKAFMQDSTSVLMAESAALALALSLCRKMNLGHTQFYTDSQLLTDCINGPDPSNPPDWRIKPFTQIIQSSTNDLYSVLKIPRTENQMADSLARRTLYSILASQPSLPYLCTNPSHSQGCPLHDALQVVTIHSVMVFASSCC
jgi:ribonuclease HI